MPGHEFFHECGGLCNILARKMDHESSIFGLPPIPPESEEAPEWMKTQRANLKGHISKKVIGACLERVKIEALLRMKQRLEEEGLEGFKLIFNADSIIDELGKVNVSR